MRPLSLLSLCLAVSALVACQAPLATQPVSEPLAPAPLPHYAVGDRFTWLKSGDEVTVEVAGITGDQIMWSATDGATWTTTADFAMPATEWSTPDNGKGQQQASGIMGALFPLEVGKTMTMQVMGSSAEWPQSWQLPRECAVESQQRVTVPAGSYDTYKVVCKSAERIYTYFYAPEIGHNVFYQNYHRDLGGRPQYLVRYERAGTS